jgi:ferredoxin
MAYVITSNCTSCGECLPVCPNQATAEGLPVYRIVALLCTECLGYAELPQCVEACPSEAIVEAAAARLDGAVALQRVNAN